MTGAQAQAFTEQLARQLTLARAVRAGLIALAVGAVLQTFSILLPLSEGANMVVLLAAGGAWILLSGSGAVATKLLQAASAHVAAERYDLAQRALVAAAMRFNFQPAPRLTAVQHLATLLHEARQYASAAQLSRFLISHAVRVRNLRRSFDRAGRLLLADCEVMQGRLHEAYEQLSILYQSGRTLSEQLALLPVECYYEVSVGAWDGLADEAPRRARLTELMGPMQAASTLACLALGCDRTGRVDQRDWLWRQATLLVDRHVLVDRLPRLEALPASAAMVLPWERTESGETP